MNRVFCVLIIFSVFSLPCEADEADNIQAVRDMTEAINNRDLDALDGLISANVVRHSAATPGVVITSLDEFRAFLESDFSTVPDSVQEIEIILVPGENL